MKSPSRFTTIVLLAVSILSTGAVIAQSYPNKPIRIVVPFAAGGAMDILARLIGPKMTDSLKQPIIVENRVGAGGHIAQAVVAKAPPDGYMTLLDTPNLAIGPALYRKLPFDAAKDFLPVTMLVRSPLILMAGPKSSVTSVGELIALAKSKPGGLNYGHNGVGSTLHLIMELIKLSTSTDMLGIPYKGVAPLSNALMTGEVDVGLLSIPTALQGIKMGRMRALSVVGDQRVSALPDVPTLAEAGVTANHPVIWYGLFVPANTPRDIVKLIYREAAKALHETDIRERIIAMGQEPVGSTPEEFDAKYKENLAQFAKIVKDARIPLQD